MGMQAAALDVASRAAVIVSGDYRVGAGDALALRVRGKVNLNYGGNARAGNSQGTASLVPDVYEVRPDGTVQLPMIGPVTAVGRSVDELKTTITEKLSEYYKNFTVDLSIARSGLVKVWVNGQVKNPGPQALPSTATVLEALLRAEIQPTGSTRLVKLTRRGKSSIIDIYGIVSRGEIKSNVTLEAGDEILVPAATSWVTVSGEVCRPGKFEMVVPGKSDGSGCRARDVIGLAMGMLPTAASARAMIERSSADGEVNVIHCDLSAKEDPILQPGDKLIIPSVADFQPTIRLVGEFKGEGVYQLVAGTVENKSGVYKFAQGETICDVITRTGGTTPQADLRRAKIERKKDGKLSAIPVDLERLLIQKDKSADVVLQSGDAIVLPALQDKVYVFGQVGRPGGFAYEPDRRLLDYLAAAGGPSGRAKETAYLVRGSAAKPETTKVHISKGMRGAEKDNPIVQPGDIIYLSEEMVSDWRDLSQLITTVRMLWSF
jgi:protein involved in polysaccharide export with SLBB domain